MIILRSDKLDLEPKIYSGRDNAEYFIGIRELTPWKGIILIIICEHNHRAPKYMIKLTKLKREGSQP